METSDFWPFLVGSGLFFSLLGILWIFLKPPGKPRGETTLRLDACRWRGFDVLLIFFFHFGLQIFLTSLGHLLGNLGALFFLKVYFPEMAGFLKDHLGGGPDLATPGSYVFPVLLSGPVGGSVTVLFVFLVVRGLGGSPLLALGFRKFPGWKDLLGLTLLLAFFVIACSALKVAWEAFLQEVFQRPPEVQPALNLYTDAVSRGEGFTILLVVVGAVVVAPVAEEVLFRGLLYGYLRKHMGPLAAGAVSGLVFSLVHITPSVLLPVFVLGWLLCAVYERRGSLYDAIFFHALFNTVTLAFTAVVPSG